MSISSAVRVLNRNAKKKFPEADQADLNEYLKALVGFVIADPKAPDADAVELADAQLVDEANGGQQWAINLRDSVLLNVVKPIVDKAEAKGVEAVTALILADFTEEQAEAYVQALKDRGDEPTIPAQSNDGDNGQDDDEDEDSFDPAVTVSH